MRHLFLTWAFCLSANLAAHAQVFVGVSDTGSVVLSSSKENDAATLLIEAEVVPPAAQLAQSALVPALNAIPADYRLFVQEASLATQVPSELIHAVILVESNYNPRAQSPKGAQGLMQLMPTTARRFGNVNSWDPRQNILTGSKYLRWLLDFFDQNVELAVAGYNAGESAVVNAGRKIPQYSETVRYVPKVLSIYNKARRLSI
jgi:soluble lytic murein transglycosylase-like protein